MESLDRFTHVPGLIGDRATIRGMRVTVAMILSQLTAGQTEEELLVDFPYLEREDITQAIGYGAWLASSEHISLKTA